MDRPRIASLSCPVWDMARGDRIICDSVPCLVLYHRTYEGNEFLPNRKVIVLDNGTVLQTDSWSNRDFVTMEAMV